MVMSWIFTTLVLISVIGAFLTGHAPELAASIPQGAQAGITLVISISGSICLWTGIGKLMEAAGLTDKLSKFLGPILHRLFPSTMRDPHLARCLSANICANLLGLGNAATPMGIQAAQRLADKRGDRSAGDELCRLIVLNTASIQLIPATVAAVRGSLGSAAPFDILPAVWITSLFSASAGLCVAWTMGKVTKK